MKKLRILALVHDHLVPPSDVAGIDVREADWKMEYDVVETLKEGGHEVHVIGLNDELAGIRPAVSDFNPHIVFNLMEAFAGVPTFDQNVVSYLELLRLSYTGCNPRGLILARDKGEDTIQESLVRRSAGLSGLRQIFSVCKVGIGVRLEHEDAPGLLVKP